MYMFKIKLLLPPPCPNLLLPSVPHVNKWHYHSPNISPLESDSKMCLDPFSSSSSMLPPFVVQATSLAQSTSIAGHQPASFSSCHYIFQLNSHCSTTLLKIPQWLPGWGEFWTRLQGLTWSTSWLFLLPHFLPFSTSNSASKVSLKKKKLKFLCTYLFLTILFFFLIFAWLPPSSHSSDSSKRYYFPSTTFSYQPI